MIQINVHGEDCGARGRRQRSVLGSARCVWFGCSPSTGQDRHTEEEQQQIFAKRATRHVEFKDDPNQFNVDVERE